MPDFLTRRDGTWHFVRRVPTEFARFDARGIIRHSTKVRIRDDRNGRRASRVAEKLNSELEAFWRASANGPAREQLTRYDDARRYARTPGFEYVENDQLLQFPIERLLERLEALAGKRLADKPAARAAMLGTEKPLTEVTHDDGLDYVEWWRGRIVKGDGLPKTAHKDIGHLSCMLKDVNVRRRLNIPDIFKGLKLRGETEKSRVPCDTDFIQNKLLAAGALDGLNEEAWHVIYVVADTGMRPSEVVNLTENEICLDVAIRI